MTAPTVALVIAHPGHELIIHHWLETARPVVFALTDGSGSTGSDRRSHSIRVIRAAGATVGSVFGLRPDSAWYDAILAGDRTLFDEAADGIAGELAERGLTEIVTDAVEYFSPMHDLCHAMARSLAVRLASRGSSQVPLFDYPNERPDLTDSVPARSLTLSNEALARKMAAIRAYSPLEAEAARRTEMDELLALERFYPIQANAGWPQEPPEEPFYERFGRRRIGDRRYARLITYRDHVRPLSVALTSG